MGAILKALEPPKSPLTTEVQNIKRLLDELEDENLTKWEMGFVESLQSLLNVYEGSFFVSPSQGDWLNKLAEKYRLDPA